MKDIVRKLTSRKFIVTAISAISGIVTFFVGEQEVIQTITSSLMVVLPTIVYCITEGMIDAKSVKTITNAVADTAEKLGADEKVVEVIEHVGEMGEILVGEETKED